MADFSPLLGLPIPTLPDVDNVPAGLAAFAVAAEKRMVFTADSRSDMKTNFPASDPDGLLNETALCIVGPAREVWMHTPGSTTWTALVVPVEGFKPVPMRSGYKSGFQRFEYRRRWAGPGLWEVTVRGAVTGNSDQLTSSDAGAYVADIPDGYRPNTQVSPSGSGPGPSGGPPWLDIEPSGGVQFVAGDTVLPIGSVGIYIKYDVDVAVDDLQ